MASSSTYAFFYCHYAFQKFPFFCVTLCVLHALQNATLSISVNKIFFLDFFNFCWVFQKFPFFCVTLYFFLALNGLQNNRFLLVLQYYLLETFDATFPSLFVFYCNYCYPKILRPSITYHLILSSSFTIFIFKITLQKFVILSFIIF